MNTPKRLISAAIALTLAIVPSLGCASESISGLQLSAAAAEVNQPSEVSNIWNGSEDTSWYNDNDTTFSIRTAEQLAGLSKLVREGNSMEGKLITLESDIVLNDTSNFSSWDDDTHKPKNNWIPIGIAPMKSKGNMFDAGCNCFSGVFNGNGHTIIGMYSLHDNYAGLFAKVKYGGIFKTIVKDSYVKAKSPQNKSWDTMAAGIAVDCVSSVVSECEFDGIVIASYYSHSNLR